MTTPERISQLSVDIPWRATAVQSASWLPRMLNEVKVTVTSFDGVKPLSGESQLTLHTLGHNPAVLDGHPFQINVTVTTNLDKILDVVTAGGRLSQDIIRAIVGAHR